MSSAGAEENGGGGVRGGLQRGLKKVVVGGWGVFSG